MRNTLPVKSEGRCPRGIVKVNDQIIPGWIDLEFDNNTFYQADTFNVRFALSRLPKGYGADWWAKQQDLFVEIFTGFPKDPDRFTTADLDSMFYGKVDDITFDPVGRVIEVYGRDLTSELIDSKTIEKFQNLTSSQIVEKIAKRHNLTPVVTKTTTRTGRYYEIDHVRLNDQRSEWDLITWLAQQEDFIVYVRGKELHFEPKPSPSQDPYVLQWKEPDEKNPIPEFNGMTLSFVRSLTLAKDVIVEVRSWNPKTGQAYTKRAHATHNKNTVLAGAAQPLGDAQVYSYTKGGMTPEETLQWAQAKLKEITAHERRFEATLPGDNILRTIDPISARGTKTAFDQTYFPDSIRRKLDVSGGYFMTVTAKNHSPESVVLA